MFGNICDFSITLFYKTFLSYFSLCTRSCSKVRALALTTRTTRNLALENCFILSTLRVGNKTQT